MRAIQVHKFIYKVVIVFFSVTFIIYNANIAFARRGWQGCCSWHGGIAYQCINGHMLCNDGTLSPSCVCGDTNQLPPIQIPSYLFLENYNQQKTFQNWHINTNIKEGNTNAFIEAYTFYNGSSFREQYSTSDNFSGGLLNGNSGTVYYINYVFITDLENFSTGDDIELLYSFDQSKSFKYAKVLKYEYTNGKMIIFFQPEDVPNFHKKCIHGATITIKLITSRMNTWTRFVLYGYTKADNAVYSTLH